MAEDIGHHIGDGCMLKEKFGGRTRYCFYYAGHARLDLDYFKTVLIPRKKALYGFKRFSFKSKGNEMVLYFKSVGLYNLYKRLGVGEGKKEDIGVPPFVLDGAAPIKKAFLRGLFDADGSIAFKRRYRKIRYYPTVSISTKSNCLAKDVSQLLCDVGFGHNIYRYSRIDKRSGKEYVGYKIEANGKKKLEEWMGKIGSSNKKHLDRYGFWKEHGFYENGPGGI